ncbi:hypothetical protein KDA_71840 [Dictyobacter alpinus]|uniref:Cyclic nucleotide-binding domain-containing protein n=1 Tax=Dictyobacter alpinus TaxID=2014873 RepID=A0A402BK45_9CHLR|nr:cyclic nucleotide-binding domain-containing thioredoxin-disulfide reductase [Dictyobacter alpinus]GCE31700.1 hypothetical protein KDA_71840 [Dictyobacter alpinus]
MITEDLLLQIPLFSQLSPQQLTQIAARAADVQLQAGEWLIQEGEVPSFFVLLAGSFDVIKQYGDVDHIIDKYATVGEYFGELPLLIGSTAIASLRATEPSRILRLDPIDFHTFIVETPALSSQLLKTMARRVGNLQRLTIENNAAAIRVIGYRWDPQCHELRDFLARNRVPFEWLTPTESAAQVYLQKAEVNNTCPLVVLQDGSILVTPALREVAERIGLQTMPSVDTYDLAIIGAGPAGLAAAVYGASEGLKTLLIDREAPGGQAGTSSRIENYLGFPAGLSGEELSRRAWQQARRFGAEILVARKVESINLDEAQRGIVLDGGECINAKAIVIATGVNWRLLALPNLDQFVGRGIYYGAARTEALGTNGKDVYLVGGGNSAGQAAIFFANYARSVTILIRGASLSKTMSQYLIDQLATKANITVQAHSEIVAGQGKEHLEAIVVRNNQTQTEQVHQTSTVFVFIGADAQTEWLPEIISRDDDGYILTGQDVLANQTAATHWPLTRDPFLLETSVPGIFAAGDVRHGSVKRVASGVGEGSISISFIHQYLADLTDDPTI